MLEGEELLALADWVFASFNPGKEGLSADQREAEKAKLLRRLDVNADGAMDFGEFANWFRRISTSIKKFESKASAVEAHRAATGRDQGSTGGSRASSVSGKGSVSQFSGKGSAQKGGAAQ